MTGLHRTALTTSQKVECAAMAAAGQEVHGTVSEISWEFGISRPTVYEVRSTACEVLRGHFEKEESAYRSVRVEVDEAQLERAVVALRVEGPNAIRPIEELLPILYPGVRVSYGKIQSILVRAEGQAKAFNEKADLSPIKNSALDEMFSQGDPVLAGVDLTSGYLFSVQLREGRSGEDWSEVLDQAKAQGLDLAVVVKDAAKGIAAGVHAVFPEAEQRDDGFHVLYELNKVRRQLEQRAYAAIRREEESQESLGRIRAKDQKRRRGQKQKIARARRECQQAMPPVSPISCPLSTGQIPLSHKKSLILCTSRMTNRFRPLSIQCKAGMPRSTGRTEWSRDWAAARNERRWVKRHRCWASDAQLPASAS